jgi:hypothetical protein
MGQMTLFGKDFGVKFSSDLFCQFARCEVCGVYVYRVDSKFGLYIGDLLSYTFLKGVLVCADCWKKGGDLIA